MQFVGRLMRRNKPWGNIQGRWFIGALCSWFVLQPLSAQAQTFTLEGLQKGPLVEGRGAAWGDFDGDGDLDLFFAINAAVDQLYQNNRIGAGTNDFSSIGPNAGIIYAGQGEAIALGDHDNDGDLDIFLSRAIGGNLLYTNNGTSPATFIQEATQVGLTTGGGGRGAAWFDYDNDGDLDLFLAVSIGTPDRLYRNDGVGATPQFTDVAPGAGLADTGNTGSATLGDYDDDGDLDIYLIKDGGNRLYRNDGVGATPQFTDVAGTAGVNINAGVGADWGDYDGDGDLDLYVTHNPLDNKLYENDGNFPAPQFTDAAPTAGVVSSNNTQSGTWADYDNDGDLDLYITRFFDPNELYQNDGTGSFTQVAEGLENGGQGFDSAWADYDNDGDLDIFLTNNLSGSSQLYENGGNANRWLQVELTGGVSNVNGIGATLRATTGATTQRRQVNSGQSHLSQGSMAVEFGFGATTTIDVLEVLWPSGITQTLTNVNTNQVLPLVETPNIAVSMPQVTATYNQTTAIPVQVSNTNGGDIVAAEVFVCYDGDVITAFSTGTSNTLLTPNWSVETNIVEGIGTNIDTAKIAMATDNDKLSGAGTLIYINFTVADLRSPAFSELTLEHVLFNDGNPANTTTDGSVTLVGNDGAISCVVFSSGSSTQVIPRQTIKVTVNDIDENRDSNNPDSFAVRATNGGQAETITVTETGNSSGIFEGTITTAFSLGSTSGDGTLQAKAGDTIQFCFDDSLNALGNTEELCVNKSVIGGTDGAILTTIVTQPGDTLRVRVTDADLNADDGTQESVQVTATNDATLESESITLNEQGINSDIFFGIVKTAPGNVAGPLGDATLNTKEGDVIDISYLDDLTVQGGTATLIDDDEVVDPFGDADDNGAVQAFDAAKVLLHVLSPFLTGLDSLSANLDSVAFDAVFGKITPFDASLVLQKRVGLIGRFPVQRDKADNHPQPETDNSVPKLVVDERLLSLHQSADYISLWIDTRDDILSGDLLIEGIEGKIEMGHELGDFLAASSNTDAGLRLVFAGAQPVSGPGELLRIYPGVGPDKLQLTRALFNDGRIAARLDAIPSMRTLPTTTVLHANMPNPFNPETTIRFNLVSESEVRLEIFDILGQRVRTLLTGTMAAGTHQVIWNGQSQDGTPLGNGVYFYRLQTGDIDQTRRMLLLK
jgi:hypothetical protein